VKVESREAGDGAVLPQFRCEFLFFFLVGNFVLIKAQKESYVRGICG
jgi:hypothetical protein